VRHLQKPRGLHYSPRTGACRFLLYRMPRSMPRAWIRRHQGGLGQSIRLTPPPRNRLGAFTVARRAYSDPAGMVGRTLSALCLSSLAPPPPGEGPSASGFHPGDCCLRIIDTRLVRNPHHFAELLALKQTFTIEATPVQSDDSNLALTQAKWLLVGTGSNANLRGAEIAKSIFAPLRSRINSIQHRHPPSVRHRWLSIGAARQCRRRGPHRRRLSEAGGEISFLRDSERLGDRGPFAQGPRRVPSWIKHSVAQHLAIWTAKAGPHTSV
jgi:hypothetical protein